jgi:1-acyl-sn-glycerol-3-phosphate acyltransferase
MDITTAWRATRQWVPFALRTVGFGTVSLTLGPLTRDHAASLWAMRAWCRSSLKGLRIEVAVEGLENVPKGAYVYCSNHQSLVDVIVLGAVLPGDYKWAAKRELLSVPFLGWHLKLAGHVPVERSRGSRAAAEVIGRFEDTLRRGKPLLIFPEGTRTPDGRLHDFKNGGFYAAVRAGVPVVPVALEGTYTLMRRGALDTGDGSMRLVRVKIGAPIPAPPEGRREGDRVAALRDGARAAVLRLIGELGGDTEPAGASPAPSPEPLEERA